MELTLTEAQRAFVRELLFDELKVAGHALAEHAHEAAEAVEATSCIAGDDAHGVWRNRVQAAAGLLDVIGWSVLGDGPSKGGQ